MAVLNFCFLYSVFWGVWGAVFAPQPEKILKNGITHLSLLQKSNSR